MLSCFSRAQLFATPWTEAHQTPLSMEFSRQECWSALPFPPRGDLPDPGIVFPSPLSPALTGGFLSLSHQGSPIQIIYKMLLFFNDLQHTIQIKAECLLRKHRFKISLKTPLSAAMPFLMALLWAVLTHRRHTWKASSDSFCGGRLPLISEHRFQKTASLLQDEIKRWVLLRTLPCERPCLGWGRDWLDSTAGLLSREGGGLGIWPIGQIKTTAWLLD